MEEILDACCGGKKFWFDKSNEHALFVDIREETHDLSNGSKVVVKPDMIADFRQLPFEDESFYHVVFDPPHLRWAGSNSYMALSYGRLSKSWKDDLKRGFDECMRVLKPKGTLVFKWSEKDIKLSTILRLFDTHPLYGNRTSKNTVWMVFMKF